MTWQRIWFWNGLAYLDTSTFYLPWYAHMGEALRSFDIPGWNPNQFSGTPFASDPQSGWMYLPAMIFFTVLGPIAAYQWFLVFHIALAGVSAYAYARVLGLRPLSGLVAASAYAFGPLVNHISCCVIHVQLASWIPSALLGVELATRAGRWPGRFAGWVLAGFAISQMLAGWVGQGAYNSLLVVGSYVVYRTVLSPIRPLGVAERLRRVVVDGAGILLIGLGLAAGGLLPRLDINRGTNVAGGVYTGAGSENYSLGWTPTQLLDRLMGNGHSYFPFLFYLGGSALTLAFAAPIVARRRFAAPYFLGLTAVTTVMTLEQITPLHRLLYLLPRFEALHEHVPNRIVAVQWIGPAMLAGAAVEAILRGETARRLHVAAAVPLLIWTVVVVDLEAHGRGIGIATLAIVAGICVGIALLAVPRIAALPSARTVLAVALLLAVLWEPTGRAFVGAIAFDQVDPVLVLPSGPVSREAIERNAAETDPGGAGAFLQSVGAEGGYWRFFGYDPTFFTDGDMWPTFYRESFWNARTIDLLVNARAMRLGLYDVQGYDPVQLSRYVAFLNLLNRRPQNYHDAQILPGGVDSPMLDLLNVRYIVLPLALPMGPQGEEARRLVRSHREVFRNESVRVLENADALPRAWAVHRAERSTEDEARRSIAAGSLDPRTTVALPSDAALPALAVPAGGAEETVAISGFEPDRVQLTADLSADGVVVVSEVYDRGWNAYVDGREVPLYLADGVLRGVPVPAGAHRVELRYEPRSLTIGLWISLATAAAILAIFAAFGWRRIAGAAASRP